MKSQYLGDSKDSFKWDYLDHLTASLPGACLQIAWMMTPDDATSDGKTKPEWFPANREVLDLCSRLRGSRTPESLAQLPLLTGRSYKVQLDSWATNFTNHNRRAYFDSLAYDADQVLFLDPDNGMEPECSYSEKHVLYQDLHTMLERISEHSVITIFQHHRRKKFVDDFARIRERINIGHSTAIYWHSLMFVGVSRSQETIDLVRQTNDSYAKSRPVGVVV